MIITCFKNMKPQDKSTPTSVQPPNTAIDSQYLILQANTFIATQNNSTIRYDFVRYFDSDKTTMGFSIFWNLLHYLSKQKNEYEQISFINNNHPSIHLRLLMSGFNNYRSGNECLRGFNCAATSKKTRNNIKRFNKHIKCCRYRSQHR